MFRRSLFGETIARPSGILELMEDLGRALTTNKEAIMMGGGNPAQIPAMQERWRQIATDLLADETAFGDVLANYDPPAGNPAFLEELAGFLNRQCGWDIGPQNLAITAGGQTAFFFLINLFGGIDSTGHARKILLPIVPEYIGYAPQGLSADAFVGIPGKIEKHGDHRFKYRIDFDRIEITDEIGAICISRPTNPSANVVTDEELEHLAALAAQHDLPLLLDNAYGLPFPGVIFKDAKPFWHPNVIQTMSLSKLGLPGIRTGIVAGPEDVIHEVVAMTAVTGLANNNVGQALVRPLLQTDELHQLASEVVRPYYAGRCEAALAELDAALEGCPYRVHEPEGAFFLWLWLEDLPITSRELYLRLKDRGVIVVPGDYFFYGMEAGDEAESHSHQCLRISYTQPAVRTTEGMRRIGEEIRAIYAAGK